MSDFHPQYIVDDQQNRKGVIVTVEEWDRIMEELEELDDIHAYDKAKAGPQEKILLDQAVAEIQNGIKR